MFASWQSITLQNIWALLQSWMGQNFAILGQNSQIRSKNREKLGIILVFIFVDALAQILNLHNGTSQPYKTY